MFGILYILTLLSIYNTDNTYYIVLYMIFAVFLFASNLILLDLDIFAGLLLLIESVVILMLFFLIIYLTPNISFSTKNQK
jgi:NADH:ubiquinone oxidoreductase subunit 6 (subunit J)